MVNANMALPSAYTQADAVDGEEVLVLLNIVYTSRLLISNYD